MTSEDFTRVFELLTDCFHVVNAEKKQRAYYRYFKHENEKRLQIVFDQICRTMDRFPTPQQIAEILRGLNIRTITKISPTDCGSCDGNGFISALDKGGHSWAYRCSCANGAYYPHYPEWFGTTHPDKKIVGTPLDDVKQNPKIYLKGLKYLESIGIKVPIDVKNKILNAANNQNSEEEYPW